MPTATKKEHLQATAQVLADALRASPLTLPDVARRIGKSPATLHLWQKGYHGVSPINARALGKVLEIDPRTIASIEGPPKRWGGKRNGAGRPLKAMDGPAARAVALLEARGTPVLTAQELHAAQGGSRRSHAGAGVFRMEVRDNGTMAVWVQTEYPLDKGAQFVRWLLDFGLLPAPPDPPA